MVMDIHESMNRFRLASRELFNHYFSVPQGENAFEYYDGFNEVERVLFTMLVLEPCSVPRASKDYTYGIDGHPGIRVRLPIANVGEYLVGDDTPQVAPIMLNRELTWINSGYCGYWDFPLNSFSNEATLLYVSFFDWESMAYRDNAYVRVQVSDWPSHPEAIGRHGLVESFRVRYVPTNPVV